MCATTAPDALQSFPFFELPPELQLMVWDVVAADFTPQEQGQVILASKTLHKILTGLLRKSARRPNFTIKDKTLNDLYATVYCHRPMMHNSESGTDTITTIRNVETFRQHGLRSFYRFVSRYGGASVTFKFGDCPHDHTHLLLEWDDPFTCINAAEGEYMSVRCVSGKDFNAGRAGSNDEVVLELMWPKHNRSGRNLCRCWILQALWGVIGTLETRNRLDGKERLARLIHAIWWELLLP